MASSPLALDASQALPFFLAHGTADGWVPSDAARRFAEKLRTEAPIAPVYVEFPGALHGFDLVCSPRFDAALEGIDRFLERQRSAQSGGVGEKRP